MSVLFCKSKEKFLIASIEVSILIATILVIVLIIIPKIVAANAEELITMNINETRQIEVDYDVHLDCSEEAESLAIESLGVQWTSSNGSVVQVDDSGMITAVGQGTATVSARADDFAFDIDVIVKVPLQAITTKNLKLNTLGELTDISYSMYPGNADCSDATITIADDSIAEIVDGQIRGVSAGETTLTISSDGVTTKAKITVLQATNSISAEDIKIRQDKSDTIEITTDVEDPDCGTTYTYTSADESIATVDEDGTVTGVSTGSTVITIENELGQSCEATVKVTNKYVVSVTEAEIADMARIVQLETNGACYYTHYLTACVMVNRLLDWGYSSMTEVIYAKNQYSTAYMTTSYIADDVWEAVYEALTDPDRNVHYQDSCSTNGGKTVYWKDPTTGEKIYY